MLLLGVFYVSWKLSLALLQNCKNTLVICMSLSQLIPMYKLVNSSRTNDVKLTLASFCQAKSFYFYKEYGDGLYNVNCAVSSKLRICILCRGHSVDD